MTSFRSPNPRRNLVNDRRPSAANSPKSTQAAIFNASTSVYWQILDEELGEELRMLYGIESSEICPLLAAKTPCRRDIRGFEDGFRFMSSARREQQGQIHYVLCIRLDILLVVH